MKDWLLISNFIKFDKKPSSSSTWQELRLSECPREQTTFFHFFCFGHEKKHKHVFFHFFKQKYTLPCLKMPNCKIHRTYRTNSTKINLNSSTYVKIWVLWSSVSIYEHKARIFYRRSLTSSEIHCCGP